MSAFEDERVLKLESNFDLSIIFLLVFLLKPQKFNIIISTNIIIEIVIPIR